MVGNYRELCAFFFVCVQDQDEVEFHENTEKEEVNIQPP